jgi:hypothetical protein
MGLEKLLAAGVKVLEISVSESPVQMATYRAPLPSTEEELVERETRTIFRTPRPCCVSEDA